MRYLPRLPVFLTLVLLLLAGTASAAPDKPGVLPPTKESAIALVYGPRALESEVAAEPALAQPASSPSAVIDGPALGEAGKDLTFTVATTEVDQLVIDSTFGILITKIESDGACELNDGGTQTRLHCDAQKFRVTLRSDYGQRLYMRVAEARKEVGIGGDPPDYQASLVHLYGVDQNVLVGQTGYYSVTAVNLDSPITRTFEIDLVMLAGIPPSASFDILRFPAGCTMPLNTTKQIRGIATQSFGPDFLHCSWEVGPNAIREGELDLRWQFADLHAIQIFGDVDGQPAGYVTRHFSVVTVEELTRSLFLAMVRR